MWFKRCKQTEDEQMRENQTLRNTQDASRALHEAADHLDQWVQRATRLVIEKKSNKDGGGHAAK